MSDEHRLRFTSPPTEEQVFLERLKVAVTKRVGAATADSVQARAWKIDNLVDEMAVELSAAVYAQRLTTTSDTAVRTVSFMVPATTWAMFKDRHAYAWWLRWWVKRRPPKIKVLTETVRLTTEWVGYATFPDLNTVVHHPHLGDPVFVTIQRRKP